MENAQVRSWRNLSSNPSDATYSSMTFFFLQSLYFSICQTGVIVSATKQIIALIKNGMYNIKSNMTTLTSYLS